MLDRIVILMLEFVRLLVILHLLGDYNSLVKLINFCIGTELRALLLLRLMVLLLDTIREELDVLHVLSINLDPKVINIKRLDDLVVCLVSYELVMVFVLIDHTRVSRLSWFLRLVVFLLHHILG